MILDEIARILRPIRARLQLMIGRAIVKAVINSSGTQRLQITLFHDEVAELEKIQAYGFDSYPPADSEAVALFIGGNRENGLVISTADRRYRPTDTQEGESILYTKEDAASQSHRVHLKTDGSIEIIGGTITLKGTLINLLDAGGQPVLLETVINKFNTHTHLYTPGPGAPTASAVPNVLLVAGTDSAANVKAKP